MSADSEEIDLVCATHCCPLCGCKYDFYGKDCPVFSGKHPGPEYPHCGEFSVDGRCPFFGGRPGAFLDDGSREEPAVTVARVATTNSAWLEARLAVRRARQYEQEAKLAFVAEYDPVFWDHSVSAREEWGRAAVNTIEWLLDREGDR